MSRKPRPGAFAVKDAPMLELLFDIAEREHVVDTLKRAHQWPSKEYREGFAISLGQLLLPKITEFIGKLYESGRGQNATEFDVANSFRYITEEIIKRLKSGSDGAVTSSDADEWAYWLEQAWIRFMSDAAASSIRQKVTKIMQQKQDSDTANEQRATEANDKALNAYGKWLSAHRPRLERIQVTRGSLLTGNELLKQYANTMRPKDSSSIKEQRAFDRQKARLKVLLEVGTLPLL
jgi:hypothetical protein